MSPTADRRERPKRIGPLGVPRPLWRAVKVLGRSMALFVGLASLTAAGAILLLSQTVVGRSVVANLVMDALGGVVNGEVRVGPILGGNMLTRAHLARFEILEPDGTPFVRLDSVRLAYNPLGFLVDAFEFREVTIERARISLIQGRDGHWNFDRLFGDDPTSAPPPAEVEPDPADESRTRVALVDVTIREGTLDVITPWAHRETGAVRDSAISQGLRGDRLWRVRRQGPDRYVREIRLDSLSGGFPLIRLVHPRQPFSLELEGVAAAASVVTQVLDVTRFDGTATFRDTIAVEVGLLETGGSSLRGDGWIVPSRPEQFRFDLEADPIGFADLGWLPVPLPRTGGGPARLNLWTAGEVIVVDVSGGDVRSGDSRVRGSFVLALEDPPRFESLDVLLQPLRLALVDEVLERDPLIDGYVTGAVNGSGPIDLMQLHADLTLEDAPDSVPPAAPSFVTVEGGLAIVEPREMRSLELTFLEFEPRWTAVVGITHPVRGRLEGRTILTGLVGEYFDFDTDLTHLLPTGTDSHLTGSGSVILGDEPAATVDFMADPLALTVLQPYAPPDLDLVGDVRGPVTARGLFSDLRILADLRTPRGLVNFDGRFDLMAEQRRYDAQLRANDIQLRQWVEQGPSTRLAVEGRVRGVGTDPATLEATFDLTVLRSLFEGARVDSSLLRFTLSGGLAVADTFAIRTDAGTVNGRGSFGLAEETSGSLILDVDAPQLSSWNRWIVPGRNPARQDTSLDALFEAFPVEGEDTPAAGPAPAVQPDTISGAAQALMILYGNVHDFAFGGRLWGSGVSYGPVEADSIQLTLDIYDPRDLDSLSASAILWRARGLGMTVDTADVRWDRIDASSSEIDAYARRDTSLELDVHGVAVWTESERRMVLDRLEAGFGAQRVNLDGRAEIAWGDAGFSSRGLSLAGARGEVIRLEGVVPDSGAANLDFAALGIELGNLFRLPDEPRDYGGRLDVAGRLRGTADDPRWDLDFDVVDPELRGLRYGRLAGSAVYAARRMEIEMGLSDNGTSLGRLDGHVLADLTLREVADRWGADPIHLTLRADSLPMEPLELAFESLRDVEGFGRGRIEFTGEPGELRLHGAATLSAAAATVPYLGVRFRDVEAALRFEGEEARLESASLRSSAGGTASIRGSVDTSQPTDLGFDLTLVMSRLRPMDRRMARFILDGEGHLAGSYRSPDLTGSFRVSEGQIRAERFLRMRQAVDLTDPGVAALIDTTLVMERRLFERAQNPFMQNLRMNADFTVGPDFWLRSEALEVELSGTLNVQMDRAQQDLLAFGTLNLARGKYRYVSGSGTDLASLYSRQLQISGGSITFTGTPGMDPNLDIQAEYETRSELGPVTITVDIGGTATAPTMDTSSDPPLPAADEVCYLLFSTACLGAGTDGGEFAASLVREGLLGTVSNQFSQVLVSGVGIVDYFDIRSTGQAGTIQSGETQSLLYGTEIEIGRYLTPDLFVRATQPIGGELPGFAVEWSFLPQWRLEFLTEDRFKRYASYGYAFSAYSARTFGLMLFRDWNF